MELNKLVRSKEDYSKAISLMWEYSKPLSAIEENTLVQLYQASLESVEEFDNIRKVMLTYRIEVIAAIIHRCSIRGYPMSWDEINAPPVKV